MSDQNHNNVPNFPLRTGLLGNQDSLTPHEINNLELNVTATVLTFTEKAIKLASIYVEHDGRKVVTTSDIKKGMAIYYFTFLDDATLEDDVGRWKDVIMKDIDCCECETDDDEDIPENEHGDLMCPRCNKIVVYQSETTKDEADEIYDFTELIDVEGMKSSNCQCSICVPFRIADVQLEAHTPTDPIATLLRDNILRMQTS